MTEGELEERLMNNSRVAEASICWQFKLMLHQHVMYGWLAVDDFTDDGARLSLMRLARPLQFRTRSTELVSIPRLFLQEENRRN